MYLVGVPSSDIDEVWDSVKDRISEVLTRFGDDDYTVDDVEQMIRKAEAQLWTTTDNDAIYVTKILAGKNSKELFGWMFEADALKEEHWKLWEIVKAWARENGCNTSRVVVRPGFEKGFIKHGWKKRHVTLTQEI